MEKEHREEPKTLSNVIWSWVLVLFSLFTVVPALGRYSWVGKLVVIALSVWNAWRTFQGFRGMAMEDGETAPDSESERRLEQLKSQRSAGLVTEQEYRQKRQEILKEL